MTTTIRLSLVGGAALCCLSVTAGAQSVDARWQAWIGCWTPALAEDPAVRALGSTVRVCIAPAAGSAAVEVTTINAAKVTNRTIIEADAEPHAVTRDGCEGTETARWSETGRRLYLRSALACADGTRRSSSGVLSFAEHRQWLDVRGLSINDATPSIAIARFVALEAADSVSIPADVWHATPVRTPWAEHAAVAAASPVTLADIAEVSMELEAGVASAWLVERARGLTLAIDGKKLAALADNGVPASVIDVAVALAYPDVFGIASDSRDAQRRPGVRAAASPSATRAGYCGTSLSAFYYDSCFWSLDPWSYYGGYDRRYGYGYPYGYYGYGYGSRYDWYGPYGGYYYSGGPTVVVIQNPSSSPSHGRVVKGQGYTSGAGAVGPTARSGGSFTSMHAGQGSSSAGSSSSSSASGSTSSSSSSSGGERTAVRKP
ncbi:MAG: hypothetical protein Q8K55_13270 [Gemmatimonadaceae bacterium]|nr:hypothetical protein [Gemmatimonadaceae bacterium]